MLKRIATAVVLIPIVVLLVLRAPVPVLAVFAAAVALVTVQEFLKLTESYGCLLYTSLYRRLAPVLGTTLPNVGFRCLVCKE